MPEIREIRVGAPSPVAQLHAAFGRVCARLGCTDGDVRIEFDILRLQWVAWHGQQQARIADLRTERGADELREWFLAIHKPLEDRLPTIDGRWPVRQVDPLLGG